MLNGQLRFKIWNFLTKELKSHTTSNIIRIITNDQKIWIRNKRTTKINYFILKHNQKIRESNIGPNLSDQIISITKKELWVSNRWRINSYIEFIDKIY